MSEDDRAAFALGRAWSTRTHGDARALAAALGATIEEQPGGMNPARSVIAEFHTRGRRIVLYSDALRHLGITREMAIAHECFHALEHGGVISPQPDRAADAFARGFLA